jgi:ferredoxin
VASEEKLAIRLDDDTQFPLKCDLCGGDPQCVKFCPTEALVYTDTPVEDEFGVGDMMEALEFFLQQKELPLDRQGGK